MPPSQFYKNMGSRIKRARNAARKTQEALALASGTNRTTLINIERGQQQVPVHLWLSLATALEIDGNELLPKLSPLENLPPDEKAWIEAGFEAAREGQGR